MSRIQIAYEPTFKTNENGYFVEDDTRIGIAAWTIDKHCGPGMWYPVVRCPLCNQIFALGKHSISLDGEVNASILCLCERWHVWGTLAEWREVIGVPKAAGERFLTHLGESCDRREFEP